MGIWTQGCTVGCSGCVNPETWSSDGGQEMPTKEIVSRVQDNYSKYGIVGVTFSGGEPLEQFEELNSLLFQLRVALPQLDILVYSGRLISEIKDYSILNLIDIFVDGPFEKDKVNYNLLWRGSTNQKVYLLNDNIRRRMKNVYKLTNLNGELVDQETGAEVTISPEGKIQMTGFSTLSEQKLRKSL